MYIHCKKGVIIWFSIIWEDLVSFSYWVGDFLVSGYGTALFIMSFNCLAVVKLPFVLFFIIPHPNSSSPPPLSLSSLLKITPKISPVYQ